MKPYVIVYTKDQRLELSKGEWYSAKTQDFIFHRANGPALEFENRKQWWMNDKRHRTTGPAMEYGDGNVEWYLDDDRLTQDEFDRVIEEVRNMPDELRLTDSRWWVREFK